MQKAKAQGEHVPWWKQPSVMGGSAYEGIAAIILSVKLNPTWINNVYFISAYVLMALLFVGLPIYGNNLMLQQAARRRDLSNPAKTNRKVG